MTKWKLKSDQVYKPSLLETLDEDNWIYFECDTNKWGNVEGYVTQWWPIPSSIVDTHPWLEGLNKDVLKEVNEYYDETKEE